MKRLQKTGICIFLCWRILSPRELSPRCTESIGKADGVSERALFVIDKSGIITWSYVSPVAVNPGADGILQALDDLPK